MITLLSVAVIAGFLSVEPADGQSPHASHSVCWTDWFDRDDPSVSGDWEVLYYIQRENPGKICPQPFGIEVQTLSGQSMAAAGEVIYKADTTYGFICRNYEQPDGYCQDYRVRFSCPLSFCNSGVCWTDWFDRDDPAGSGDWEILDYLHNVNPGKICPHPFDIEVQTLSGQSMAAAGEVIYKADTTYGFICRNYDQPDGYCKDYRVRFSCPQSFCNSGVCWTDWFDRDDPPGSGDWELLADLRNENPGKICPNPTEIDVQTLSGQSMAAAGEVIYKANATAGFVCRNEDQPDGYCKDYRVRFSCPQSYCDSGVCWTDWFDRDDPSVTGDWELLSNLRNENPGKICPNPTEIEVQTLSGQKMASTGDVIYRVDATYGFVCRNEDQPDRSCKDYRVRFSCPQSYCN